MAKFKETTSLWAKITGNNNIKQWIQARWDGHKIDDDMLEYAEVPSYYEEHRLRQEAKAAALEQSKKKKSTKSTTSTPSYQYPPPLTITSAITAIAQHALKSKQKKNNKNKKELESRFVLKNYFNLCAQINVI